MRKSYLLAAAVTMLTACTNNERLTNDLSYDGPVMIGFETFHEKSTKATGEITAPTNLTKDNGGFGVWGYKGAPADVVQAAVQGNDTYATVNISNASKFTSIFNNVQVWYVSDNFTETPSQGFTYAIPKYWDKGSEYIFFAYAPYNANNASIDVNTGNITISNIASIQDISTSIDNRENTEDENLPKNVQFTGTNPTQLTDYLMATYVTEQRLLAENKTTTPQGTNQNYGKGTEKRYVDQEQTVGFTFGHMLSKLRIKLIAAEEYKGIKELKVNNLSIENMPAAPSTKTSFTQNSPTGPAGTYANEAYTTELKIIENGADDEAVVTSKASLYILKDGYGKNSSGNATTTVADMVDSEKPSYNNQEFNYYVAPNDPNENANDANKKYLVNLNYTINYVDNTTENITVSDIDISSILSKLEQNYYYILTIKIQMNQILFTVDKVTNWNPTDTDGNNVSGSNDNIEALTVEVN